MCSQLRGSVRSLAAVFCTNCGRATAVLFSQVNNELQSSRQEKMRVWMSCPSLFLGNIGLTLAMFLICK